MCVFFLQPANLFLSARVSAGARECEGEGGVRGGGFEDRGVSEGPVGD